MTFGPALSTWGERRLDLFVVGADNALWHKWFSFNRWSDWESLGGTCTSNPGVTSWTKFYAPIEFGDFPDPRIDVVVRGPDNTLYHKYFSGGNWHPSVTEWESLGSGPFIGAPAIASMGDRSLDVFIVSEDHKCYHKYFRGTDGWSSWEPTMGGDCSSGPAAVSWGGRRLDVFVRGRDNATYHKLFDHGKWWPSFDGDWEYMGGDCRSGPAVSSWAPGRLDLFVQGPGNALYHRWLENGSWTDWGWLGGTIVSEPTAVSWGNGRVDVFAKTSETTLGRRSWNGKDWTGWENWWYPGSEPPDPMAPGFERVGGVSTDFTKYKTETGFGGTPPFWYDSEGYSLRWKNSKIRSANVVAGFQLKIGPDSAPRTHTVGTGEDTHSESFFSPDGNVSLFFPRIFFDPTLVGSDPPEGNDVRGCYIAQIKWFRDPVIDHETPFGLKSIARFVKEIPHGGYSDKFGFDGKFNLSSPRPRPPEWNIKDGKWHGFLAAVYNDTIREGFPTMKLWYNPNSDVSNDISNYHLVGWGEDNPDAGHRVPPYGPMLVSIENDGLLDGFWGEDFLRTEHVLLIRIDDIDPNHVEIKNAYACNVRVLE